MSRRLASLIALVLSSIAWPACAHDTWLQSRRASVPPGTIAQLDLSSGQKFPVSENAVKSERIETARARLNGKSFDIAQRAPEKKSLELRVALSDPGIATLWLTLAPKSIELTPKQARHYLDEIDAPPLLWQAWYAGKKSKQWREVYTGHAKTFVLVGRPGRAKADGSWSEPVGMPLEIVPEKDPTALRAGQEFPVRLLKNASPLADFSLSIAREGNTNRVFTRTDANGRAVFRPARAGRWLLRGTDLRASTKPATDWESDFTTLTFEVK